MNSIIFALRMLALTSMDSATVDRVESDRGFMAVVCDSAKCENVPTVAPRKGGLVEGAQLGCETFTRGDGTRAVVCQGRTVAFIGVDGTRHANPYASAATIANDCETY